MFNLLRYFSVASGIALVAISILLGVLYRQHAEGDVIETAEARNTALVRALANAVRRDYLPLPDGAGISLQHFKTDSRYAALHSELTDLVAGLPVLKVKIFNPQGITVYSSDISDVGEDKSESTGFIAAVSDRRAASKLTFIDSFNSFEGRAEDRDIVETYLPVTNEAGKIEAVFELYMDVTQTVDRITRTTIELEIGLLLLFGMLYGMLFLIVRRADRILRRQYTDLLDTEEQVRSQNVELGHQISERIKAEEALQKAHDELEHRVLERTEMLRKEISVREAAEKALRESEGRFRAIVDNSPAKIHIKDSEGRYLLINPEAERLFGVSEEEARGKTSIDLFPDSLASAFQSHDKAVIETGGVVEEEEIWQREDGPHTYLTVKFPIRDIDDSIVGVGAIGTDISNRERAEQLSQRLGRILESSFNEIYVFDAISFRFIQVSQGALKNLGFSLAEMKKKTPWDIKPEYNEVEFRKVVQPLLNGKKEILVFETTHERKDGSIYPVEVRLQLSRTETPSVFLAVIADISERALALKAIEESREEAEKANQAKSEFLAHMSHELRTPLNAIIGFSEVIGSEALGPVSNNKYRDYAKDIHGSGQHLLSLINDLLDLSKVEAGQHELEEEPVDISEVFSNCITLLKDKADDSDIAIETNVPENLPRLQADRRKVVQIFVNLLSNAIKFTPEGGRVTMTAKRQRSGDIFFEISDTGIGIAPADIPKVLAPFVQVESEYSRKHAGTGLGLPLTKSLVELHGGSLQVQSKPGAGTRVTVSFPANRVISRDGNARAAS